MTGCVTHVTGCVTHVTGCVSELYQEAPPAVETLSRDLEGQIDTVGKILSLLEKHKTSDKSTSNILCTELAYSR